MLNKIPKTLVVVIVLLAFTSQISLAGEWVLKKKDPDKAKKLATFPGFFIHGIGHYYAGDITAGSVLLTEQVFSTVLIYGCIRWLAGNYEENYNENPFGPAGSVFKYLCIIPISVGSVLSYFDGWDKDIKNSPKKIDDFNNSIENKAFNEFKTIKKQKDTICMLKGIYNIMYYSVGTVIVFGLSGMEDFSTLGILSLSSGLFVISSYLIDIYKVKNTIIEKKSNINLLPMLLPGRSGIMLVKRF